MKNLTLNQANEIASASLAKGRELGLKPLCVAILDAGGQLITLHREDGASILRPAIAVGKASGALGMGISSREIAEIAAERPGFFASILNLGPQALIPAAGGVIATDADGQAVGAVGVTGDTSDNDEICALAGIVGAGLTTQR